MKYEKLFLGSIISCLVLPALLYVVKSPLSYQATSFELDINALNSNELLENQNETIELLEDLEDSILEERIDEGSNLALKDDQLIEPEEIMDEAKSIESTAPESKKVTNYLVDNHRWENIEDLVIPQENSFIARRMHDFFVSDLVGDVTFEENQVILGAHLQRSILMNQPLKC